MGRQGGGRDPTVVSSSIALLQQRFRQLEKDRGKREEKELLKLLSETERIGPNRRPYESNSMLSANSPYRQQPHQDSSLSLGLSSHSRRTDYRAMAIPAASPTSLWPNNISSTSKKFVTSDVDTSLHL